MTLSREVYQQFEDIVGPRYISEEPAIMDSYSYQYLSEVARPNHSKFMPRPEAAILPGSTEEVQAIVRVCNRYNIKCKPYSTGWYFYAAPLSEGVVQLDLRRMDKILEIDEKNMYAVIEPYVTGATLQAELMKYGLTCVIRGSGMNCSALAGATCYSGSGVSGIFTCDSPENLLSVEWVLPNGEILRTGTLSSGMGWFCGEGPGPGLRGIIRGGGGTTGGLGVFTKCAIKLSHWPGPAKFKVEGTIPAYNSPLPDNFKAYTLAFPNWESYIDAYYQFFDNEIAYVGTRQFAMLGTELGPAFWMMYNDPTKTLDDLEEFYRKPEVQKLTEETKISFQIVLAGMTPRDIECKEKVLERILVETGGWKVVAFSDPAFEKFTLLYLLRMGKKNLNFVYGGGWIGSFTVAGTPDYINEYRPLAEKVTKPYQTQGLMVDCGADAMIGKVGTTGGGGMAGFEQFGFYDVADYASTEGIIDWMKACAKIAIDNGYPAGKEAAYLEMALSNEELYQMRARSKNAFIFRLQNKIKQMVDPNNVGDRMYPTIPDSVK